MSDRLCGYCRQPGHVNSKCPVRINQIDIVRRYVGSQRKLAQEILIANGIGPGAIVTSHDGWTGEEIPCIVSSFEPFEYGGIEYLPVKYKKQVRIHIPVYGDDIPDIQHNLIRWSTRSKIGLTVFSLADPSKDMYAYFTLDSLDNPLVKFNRGKYRGWDYNRPSRVLSQSDNCALNMDNIMRPFPLHVRLMLDKTSSNLVTPILEGA